MFSEHRRNVVACCGLFQYQVGQLFSVAEASKNETGGGEGIEILKNEPCEKDGERGQYTHKIYHLKSKVPGFVKVIAPEGSLVFHEKAWNAYPYCRTGECTALKQTRRLSITQCQLGEVHSINIHHPVKCFKMVSTAVVPNEYMEDDFFIKIETWHKPDLGTLQNVHNLDSSTWKSVEVTPIDIAAKEQVAPGLMTCMRKQERFNKVFGLRNLRTRERALASGMAAGVVLRSVSWVRDYKADEDPAIFKSVKTGRGPLGPNWKKELVNNPDCPRMCAYKLVTVKFKWWGLQNRVESFIHKQEKRIFTNFHRQLFCWIDQWVELSMEDIRRMEEETQKELEEMRKRGSVRGTKAVED
ncbi:Phosphatidylinositol transfer protein beta isoform [Labeo rohita]|uniref:Phosphatidylinositol transfer protein beta isoform n=1 Tax=Labeo rohita TaxID=84645 RepID=A0ABQ8MMG4_LABRO|nr:Phosphatidylinositol transfer protein beta isoform [Labeo rohita]